MITKETIMEIYKKHLLAMDNNKEHIKRVWENIRLVKSYDLVSKNCMNPKLKDILKSYGIKKSAEFSDPLKLYFKQDLLYFNNEFNLILDSIGLNNLSMKEILK